MGDPSYGFRLTGVREKSRKAMNPNAISTSARPHSGICKSLEYNTSIIIICAKTNCCCQHIKSWVKSAVYYVKSTSCNLTKPELQKQEVRVVNTVGTESKSDSCSAYQIKYKSKTDQIHQRGRGREYFIPMDRFLCQVLARFGQRVNGFNDIEKR